SGGDIDWFTNDEIANLLLIGDASSHFVINTDSTLRNVGNGVGWITVKPGAQVEKDSAGTTNIGFNLRNDGEFDFNAGTTVFVKQWLGGGDFYLAGATVTVGPIWKMSVGGTLAGWGTINGDLASTGTIHPLEGQSAQGAANALTIVGDLYTAGTVW